MRPQLVEALTSAFGGLPISSAAPLRVGFDVASAPGVANDAMIAIWRAYRKTAAAAGSGGGRVAFAAVFVVGAALAAVMVVALGASR